MKTAWALEMAALLLPSDLARLEVVDVYTVRRDFEQESKFLSGNTAMYMYR